MNFVDLRCLEQCDRKLWSNRKINLQKIKRNYSLASFYEFMLDYVTPTYKLWTLVQWEISYYYLCVS